MGLDSLLQRAVEHKGVAVFCFSTTLFKSLNLKKLIRLDPGAKARVVRSVHPKI